MATLDTLLGAQGEITAPQHVMVYGSPKSGKTQLIGELAKKGFKLIWFDGENGKATLLKMPREVLANITYIGMRDTVDNSIFHATMDKVVKGGDFNICETHGLVDCLTCKSSNAPFDAIVIPKSFNTDTANVIVVMDSATQLSLSIMNTVMKPIWAKDITAKIEWDHYAKQGAYLNRIFGYIQAAQYNFITTAHEIEATREDNSKRIVPSIGTTNYAINCAKFFDHVVYMDKVNMKHKAASSTSFSNNILTGSRTDVVLDSMAVPDLAGIFTRGPAPAEAASPASQSITNSLSNNNNINTTEMPKTTGLKLGGIKS
jgi:hypothetical protein